MIWFRPHFLGNDLRNSSSRIISLYLYTIPSAGMNPGIILSETNEPPVGQSSPILLFFLVSINFRRTVSETLPDLYYKFMLIKHSSLLGN
jgi:hypothetical protein